jgi:hypothetical protein
MTDHAVRLWLRDRFVDSLTPVRSYPQNATTGILNAIGQDVNNTYVLTAYPAKVIDYKRLNIIITSPSDDEVQKTGFGARGTIVKDIIFEIAVLWQAKFSTAIPTMVPGEFTNQDDSDAVFRAMVSSVEATLRLAVCKQQSAGVDPKAQNWDIEDPITHFKSRIVAEMPRVRTAKWGARLAENKVDLRYLTKVTATFKESYNALGTYS